MWCSNTMPALQIVLSALYLLPLASAMYPVVPLEGLGRESYPIACAQACTWSVPTTLDCPEFADMTPEERADAYPSAACFANDTSYLTSIAYCINAHCEKDILPWKMEKFWDTMMIYHGPVPKFSYREAVALVKKPPKALSPDETVLNHTVGIDDATYIGQLNGVKEYNMVAKNESVYSVVVFVTSVLIPIMFSLLRFLPLPTTVRSKFYAYVIDPPAWGKRHSVATMGIGMVPTRGQALFILYIIAINTVASFEGYPNLTPNGLWPERHYQLMRFIGNRTGAIAFANIPVVILYAGRNSILLRLTNWSYPTFLLLHRWIGAICVIQVILHSLLWLQIQVEAHQATEMLKIPYWIVGIVGTVFFSALLPFSVLPIRKIMYEVFLILHILLTIGALVGSWYHIIYLYEGSSGFEIWLLLGFGLWGLERLLRILRISRYGIKKAYVTRVDDKYLRLDIPDVDAKGHCYVYFPTLSWHVWENHPFSIVNCSKGQLSGEIEVSCSSSHTQSESEGAISPTEAAHSKETGVATTRTHHISPRDTKTRPGITLFVQPQRGLTAKLLKKADTGIPIPILLESSYGHHHYTDLVPTPEYPNTLVISGGVGIAGVLSALQSSVSMFARPIGTTKLFWGVKQPGLVDAVKSMIVGGDVAEEKGDGRASNWGHIETHVSIGERMDIKQVLTKELENAVGGTTVIVCGPLGMCDDARNVCSGLARHGVSVRYVEESFTW